MEGTILITGANRGIGLALVKAFLDRDIPVLGTARQPEAATELRHLIPDKDILRLDVSQTESIDEMGMALQRRNIKLNGLINNAGVYGGQERFSELDPTVLMETYRVNAVGPLMVIKTCLPMLTHGARVMNISSNMGSITNAGGGHYAYRMSKAALNIASRILSLDLNADPICVAVHPGWVQTDMGGKHANIAPHESAEALCELYLKLESGDSGKFFNYTGKPLDW
ncbi:MAG: SDR family oxidoreductase [Lentisphaeria bacterium]|nr:SDR family oxidoreductase [Candidatus Neomarinimicrobiota bacterium]MCF7842741.1 SDR family oxidoreductase [Lentisphaeria bacterium]